MQICVAGSWSTVGGPPDGSATHPARSCKQLHLDWPSAPSAAYWIDPNGGTASDAFEAYCEMSVDGGGWTRVASVGGGIFVCSLTAPLGTSQQVATGSGDAWLDPTVAAQLMVDGDVLLMTSGTSWTQYRSTDAAFTWPNVASGLISSNEAQTYAVQYRRYGEVSFQGVVNGGCNAVVGSSCLLGGRDAANTTWLHVLGIGSYDAARHNDQALCASQHAGRPWLGMLTGTTWSHSGGAYVR